MELKVEKLIDQQSELVKRSHHQDESIQKLKWKVVKQENENKIQRTEIRELKKSLEVLNNRILQLENSKFNGKNAHYEFMLSLTVALFHETFQDKFEMCFFQN